MQKCLITAHWRKTNHRMNPIPVMEMMTSEEAAIRFILGGVLLIQLMIASRLNAA
jgi:hypothetical protein